MQTEVLLWNIWLVKKTEAEVMEGVLLEVRLVGDEVRCVWWVGFRVRLLQITQGLVVHLAF